MSNTDEQTKLVPQLRFPEFRGRDSWQTPQLADCCERRTEKVGDSQLTPVSITAGTGFVPQSEKFGRDISGAQYSNYIRIERGDFAYNRGNSKRFPQGCVYQLTEFDEAAASNAFYCFRLYKKYEPAFFEGLFESNYHGRQLLKHITSSARSDGLLNIRADTFFGIKIPMPPDPAEQQKIADCLGSLDERIAAEGRKLEALRDHKKGLMQQLFPREGENRPRLRFPEFRDAGQWEGSPLGTVCDLYQPETLATSDLNENGQYLVYGANGIIGRLDRYNHEDSEIVVTCRGATCGEVGRTEPKSWITGNAMVVRPKTKRLNSNYLFYWLKSNGLKSVISGSAQPQITRSGFSPLPITFPKPLEQHRIADCLASLDAMIAAQAEKLDALRTHKRGLMQQLFPPPEDAEV